MTDETEQQDLSMFDEIKPKGRGRPKKPKVSSEAESIFPDYVPASERVAQTEHDVDDLFSGLEGQDLRGRSEVSNERHKIRQNSQYAKKVNPADETPEVTEDNPKSDRAPGSPKVSGSVLDAMVRAEEIAAELVRTQGRFIEGVDNAKPGVPFKAVEADLEAPDMPLPYANQKYKVRADGITLDIGIFDTGDGAQVSEQVTIASMRDDPASEHFMVCVNKTCRYRENCLRYRLHNKRDMKTVFYPEDCRKDGIYIDIDESDFKAIEPMSTLESTSTPSF